MNSPEKLELLTKAARASVGNCSPSLGFSQNYSDGWDAAMKVVARQMETATFETSEEATATFNYRVGSNSDSITVGAKSSTSKTRDDWMISLALTAGIEVSKKHNTNMEAILLTMDSISLSETN